MTRKAFLVLNLRAALCAERHGSEGSQWHTQRCDGARALWIGLICSISPRFCSFPILVYIVSVHHVHAVAARLLFIPAAGLGHTINVVLSERTHAAKCGRMRPLCPSTQRSWQVRCALRSTSTLPDTTSTGSTARPWLRSSTYVSALKRCFRAGPLTQS